MKIRIGVLFGGKSEEHEVSIQSVKSVVHYLDPKKYELFPIGIDKEGSWHFLDKDPFLLSLKQNRSPTFLKNDHYFPIIPNEAQGESLFSPSVLGEIVDVVFPVLHGPNGEDGSIQGLFELATLPYVGSGVLSSALCMDKAIAKDLLKGAGLPVPRYLSFHRTELIEIREVINFLKLPLFVKPANMGSSVGISKVGSEGEFWPAVEEAFKHDERIILEEGIAGREIECAVLGNSMPEASLPGEVIPNDEFYSYKAKYLDENGAHFQLPAELSPTQIKELQEIAIQAFRLLRCEGMARVDFFLRNDGKVFVNEINTIPGFTPISLYPKLWELSGVPYSDLLDRLIDLAIERFHRKKRQTLENNLVFR